MNSSELLPVYSGTTVVFTSAAPDYVYNQFAVKATFSQAVSGITASSFNISGATITEFSGSGAEYTLVLTPTADVSLSLKSDALSSQSASSTLTREYDNGMISVSWSLRES